MGDVHLTGRLVCANDEQARAVVEHLPDHIAATRAEPGCVSFDVTATTDPFVWTVDERFENELVFRAHQQRVAGSRWGRATAGIEREYAIQGVSL
jgi:quinol monooxygenase YgiN